MKVKKLLKDITLSDKVMIYNHGLTVDVDVDSVENFLNKASYRYLIEEKIGLISIEYDSIIGKHLLTIHTED